MITQNDVYALYIAMFDRAPEASGVNYWLQRAQENNWSKAQLAEEMINAAINVVNANNLVDLYPQYQNVNPNDYNSVKEIINAVYKTLFNKDETDDPAGVNYWTQEALQKGLGETIASIITVADMIAKDELDLTQYGYTPEEIEKTKAAAKAFENKVEAAKDISLVVPDVDPENVKEAIKVLQESVDKVTDDEDSIKNVLDYVDSNLEEILPDEYDKNIDTFHQMVEKLKNGEDVKPLIPIIDVSDEVNETGYTETINQPMDDENISYNLVDVDGIIEKLYNYPVEMRADLINNEKYYLQQVLDLFKSYPTITKDLIDQYANLKANYENSLSDIFAKYGYTYVSEGVTPDYRILNLNVDNINKAYQLAIEGLQKELAALNQADPNNPETLRNYFELQNEYEKMIKDVTGGLDLTVEDSDAEFSDHYDQSTSYDSDYGDYEDDDYDDIDDIIEYFKQLPTDMVAEILNNEKYYLQQALNVIKSYPTITKDLIDQYASLENSYSNDLESIFNKYGYYADFGEVKPDYSILNLPQNVIDQAYSIELEGLQAGLNALNKVDPANPDSWREYLQIQDKYEDEFDQITGGLDLTIDEDDYSYDNDDYADYSNSCESVFYDALQDANISPDAYEQIMQGIEKIYEQIYWDSVVTQEEWDNLPHQIDNLLAQYGVDPNYSLDQCGESLGYILIEG